MWLKRFTDYVLKYQWRAVAFAFFITFVPVAGIAGILLAAFITLRRGVLEGAMVTLAATAPYFVSFYFSNHDIVTPLVVWAAIGVAVASNLLTYVFAVMLRQQTSFSTLLQIAALMGVLVISIVHLINPGVADWWGVQLHAYYLQATSAVQHLASGVKAPSESQLETINTTKQFATGVMVTGVLFNAFLQLVVARWWQAALYGAHPHTLRRELQGIRLSPLAGVLFVLSIVFYYLGNAVVLDIMPVLYMLFCVAGLSLIHYLFGLAEPTPTRWFWLAVLYGVLFFSMPVSLVMVSVFALADIWLNVRKKIKKI